MNNQECEIRPEIAMNLYIFPCCIKKSKCSGCCNNINDSFAKLCVPDVVKNINLKVFNLMSKTNERRHIKFHETCKSKCRLVINSVGMINSDVNVNN